MKYKVIIKCDDNPFSTLIFEGKTVEVIVTKDTGEFGKISMINEKEND